MNDYELREQYDEMLNGAFGTVSICGIEYDAAEAFKGTDPVAYETGLSDYESFLEEEEDE